MCSDALERGGQLLTGISGRIQNLLGISGPFRRLLNRTVRDSLKWVILRSLSGRLMAHMDWEELMFVDRGLYARHRTPALISSRLQYDARTCKRLCRCREPALLYRWRSICRVPCMHVHGLCIELRYTPTPGYRAHVGHDKPSPQNSFIISPAGCQTVMQIPIARSPSRLLMAGIVGDAGWSQPNRTPDIRPIPPV